MTSLTPAELEGIAHLDHVPDVACEQWRDCTRPAALYVVCRACRIPGAMCQPCHTAIRTQWATQGIENAALGYETWFYCRHCQHEGRTWTDTFETIPIGPPQ